MAVSSSLRIIHGEKCLKRAEIREINLDILKPGAQSDIKYSLLRLRRKGQFEPQRVVFLAAYLLSISTKWEYLSSTSVIQEPIEDETICELSLGISTSHEKIINNFHNISECSSVKFLDSQIDSSLTFLVSIFLIHFIACPCGSIISGHLKVVTKQRLSKLITKPEELLLV